MMSDPLAKFRPIPGSSSGAPGEPTEYVAFVGKDKPLYLDIRRANDPAHSPKYQFYLNTFYDDLKGTNFVIFYSFMVVRVTGRNLTDMIKAVKDEKCAFIQEFDPERWPMPKDEKTPFISSIMITMEGAPMDTNKGTETTH
jgi:hypothetical protein